MDAIATMAGQLQAQPLQPQVPQPKGESNTAQLRRQLRDNGRQTASDLAATVGIQTGRVGALLKHDIHQGRVSFFDGYYEWTDSVEDYPACKDGKLRETLTWNEVADGDFPDADLTVLVRMRDVDAEPVWLGYWTGEVWREASGLEVDVVRWADMPQGGEVDHG